MKSQYLILLSTPLYVANCTNIIPFILTYVAILAKSAYVYKLCNMYVSVLYVQCICTYIMCIFIIFHFLLYCMPLTTYVASYVHVRM